MKINKMNKFKLTLIIFIIMTLNIFPVAIATSTVNNTKNIPGTEIIISDLTLNVGEKGRIARVWTPINTTDTIEWLSSNPEIATIDKYGNVTAIKKGRIRIKANLNEKTYAICTVNVKNNEIPVANKPTKASELKLYKSTSKNSNPQNLKAPVDGTTQKVQSFAITEMGTKDETIWYAFQKYDDTMDMFINAYRNDKRVYSAVLHNGGEGQGVDIDKIGDNLYKIYCQGNNERSIFSYNVSTSDKYNDTYDIKYVMNKGVKFYSRVEVSTDQTEGYAIIKKSNDEVTSYRLKSNEKETFKNSNIIKTFQISHPSSIQGGDLCGKYYYHLWGGFDGNTYIYCYDITTGKRVWDTSINLTAKIRELTGNQQNLEPEGIKVYPYKGSYKIFIGYKVKNYRSAIFYFDV